MAFIGLLKPMLPSQVDHTLYRIETNPNEYVGTIIYQDEVII